MAGAGLITSFFDAVNRGDQRQIARFFRLSFEAYTVNEGGSDPGSRSFSARNQNQILSYYAARHKQRERLQLLGVAVARAPSWAPRGSAGIEVALTRQASDIKAGPEGPKRNVHGKGRINCPDQTIELWNVGGYLPDNKESAIIVWPECPLPPNFRPGSAVIACAEPVEGKGEQHT